jgi:DNA-binding NarL/FixJ family response regulator
MPTVPKPLLFASERTVKHHLSSILFKLQMNTRPLAAMSATRGGPSE